MWKGQGVSRCCGCPELAGAGFWRGVHAVFLPASGGTAFPLAGFCCGRPACLGLGERSEVHAPRFDLYCFNHPKQASPVHMQILSKCQTVSSFCVSFNSLIFFLVWQLLCLMRIRNNPLAWSWPFCLFGCTVSDKHQHFKSFCFPLLPSSEQKVLVVGLVGWSGGTQACLLGTGLRWGRRSFQMEADRSMSLGLVGLPLTGERFWCGNEPCKQPPFFF